MDQVAQFHIGPVLQDAHPGLHQHVLVELLLLADAADVVFIHHQQQEQHRHEEEQGKKDGGHGLEKAVRLKELGDELDVIGTLSSAEGKIPQQRHHVQELQRRDEKGHHEPLLHQPHKAEIDLGQHPDHGDHGQCRDPEVIADAIDPVDEEIHSGDQDAHRSDGGQQPPSQLHAPEGLHQKKHAHVVGIGPHRIEHHQLQRRQQHVDLLPLIDAVHQRAVDAGVLHRHQGGHQHPQKHQAPADAPQVPVRSFSGLCRLSQLMLSFQVHPPLPLRSAQGIHRKPCPGCPGQGLPCLFFCIPSPASGRCTLKSGRSTAARIPRCPAGLRSGAPAHSPGRSPL